MHGAKPTIWNPFLWLKTLPVVWKDRFTGQEHAMFINHHFGTKKWLKKSKNLDLQDGVVKMQALYLQDVANQVEIPDPKCSQLQELLTTFFFLQNQSKTDLKAQN